MAYAKANHPLVLETFQRMNDANTMWALECNIGRMVRIHGVTLSVRGCMHSNMNGRRITVAKIVIENVGWRTARWINHLLYQDANGDWVKFKKHLTLAHGLVFS